MTHFYDDETECLEDMGLYASLAAVTLPDPKGGAIPTGRAATPSGPSLLHVSGVAGIAIAAFALLYFGGELLRAVL